jgi:hypothetical protein
LGFGQADRSSGQGGTALNIEATQPGVKAEEINVVRHGGSFQCVFVWPIGKPGLWRSRARQPHPLRMSTVIGRWLKRQRN